MLRGCVWILLALLVLGLPAPVCAQSSGNQTSAEVVVTATRAETDVRHLPDSVTVITREDMDERETQASYQALEGYPSISIKHIGWLGQWGYVRLRGGKNQDTVVLFDGVRLYDPTSGANDFGDLWSWFDTEGLERIEIVRGPQSALYGSNAMSGALNCISRKGGGPFEMSFKGGYGRYETWRRTGYIKGSLGPLGYFIGLAGVNTDGLYKDDKFRQDTLNTNFNLKPFAHSSNRVLESLKLDYTLRYAYGYLNYEHWDYISFRGYDDPHAERYTTIFLNHFTISLKPAEWWHSKLILGYHFFRRNYLDRNDGILGYRPNGTPVKDSYFNGLYRGKTYPVVFQNDFFYQDWIIFTVGTEYYQDEGDFYGASAWGSKKYDDKVSTISCFANLFLTPFGGRLGMNLGGRIEDHEEFGTHFTYKVGLAYFLTETLKIKGNLATGFRAPSLYNLYDPRYGNPDLDPERSTGGDIGLEQELLNGKFRWAVTWFNTHFKNRIAFNYNTWHYYNAGSGVSTGLETEVEVRPYPWLSIGLNYTYTEGQEDEYENLALVPHNQIGARISFKRPKWRLNLYYQYVGRRTAYDHKHVMPDYSRVDLTGSYKVTRYAEVFFRAENLFDVDYQSAYGYRSPGFNLLAGIKLKPF